MSTFYQWISNIDSHNACLEREREISTSGYLFFIKRMSIRHFSKNSPFKTSSKEVFHNKGVRKKIHKTHKKLYMQAALSQ